MDRAGVSFVCGGCRLSGFRVVVCQRQADVEALGGPVTWTRLFWPNPSVRKQKPCLPAAGVGDLRELYSRPNFLPCSLVNNTNCFGASPACTARSPQENIRSPCLTLGCSKGQYCFHTILILFKPPGTIKKNFFGNPRREKINVQTCT